MICVPLFLNWTGIYNTPIYLRHSQAPHLSRFLLTKKHYCLVSTRSYCYSSRLHVICHKKQTARNSRPSGEQLISTNENRFFWFIAETEYRIEIRFVSIAHSIRPRIPARGGDRLISNRRGKTIRISNCILIGWYEVAAAPRERGESVRRDNDTSNF